MKIVFDSSIWIAGVGSVKGFSSDAIFKSYKSTKTEIFISSKIMTEVRRNLISKFKFNEDLADESERIIYDLCDFKIKITEKEDMAVENIDAKDRHILALCEKVGADYLVSFDRKHLLPLKKYKKTIIVEPKDFMEILRRK